MGEEIHEIWDFLTVVHVLNSPGYFRDPADPLGGQEHKLTRLLGGFPKMVIDMGKAMVYPPSMLVETTQYVPKTYWCLLTQGIFGNDPSHH